MSQQQPARPALGSRTRSRGRASSFLQAKTVPVGRDDAHPLCDATRTSTDRVDRAVQCSQTVDADLLSDIVDDPWRDRSLASQTDQLQDARRGDAHGEASTSSFTDTDASDGPDAHGVPTIEVYVHKVRRDDTLAKIILSYGIPAAVLKRSNRIWSADVFPDVLLLPVDQCTVAETRLVDVADEPRSPALQGASVKSPRSPHAKHENSDKHRLKAARSAYLPGIGEVDVARVTPSSLSYFPPSKQRANAATAKYSDLARSSIDRDRYNALYQAASAGLFESADGEDAPFDKHRLSPPPQNRSPRQSFDSVRSLSNTYGVNWLEDAFNGTQKILKRYKSRKKPKEIDLIEL